MIISAPGGVCLIFFLLVGSAIADEKCRINRNSMMSCSEAKLDDLPKSNQPNVEWLTFRKSSIPHIKSSNLKYFPKLTDLHAEDAKIETIEDNAFQNNAILNWVDVSANKIKSIHVNLIKNLVKIEHFNISGNHGLAIPERKPILISDKLRWLDLQRCGIKQVYTETFEKLPAIRDISLAGNELKTLPEDIFRKNPGLLSFDITDNKLKFLSDKVFLNQRTMLVRFEGNPWDCGCELAPLLAWSKKNVVKGNVICDKPKNKQWKDIVDPQKCKPKK